MGANKNADTIRVPDPDEQDSVMPHLDFERFVCGDGRRRISRNDDAADYLQGRSASDPTPLDHRFR